MKEKTNEELIQINRDTLLDRMDTHGYQDGYPYGLMDEASKEIQLLREERDEARRLFCQTKHPPTDCRITENAFATAHWMGWDCFKKEETP
jgi:hypothetical protein